jgi:hypothetical protein
MSDEKKESRINVEDLPQAAKELTAEEAKDVQGGTGITKATSGNTKPDWQDDFIISGNCENDKTVR